MHKFPLLDDVLRIHDRQIEVFGGSTGVRDLGLLESALAQPQATFGGELLHPTLPEQAAAYLYHLAKNHPFIDGNKRTAFAVMDMFSGKWFSSSIFACNMEWEVDGYCDRTSLQFWVA